MWGLLRHRKLADLKFRRQVPFRNYVLDFVCFEQKIVVEIDGSQHLESQSDEARDRLLADEGFSVVRYWNNDVLRTPAVVLEDLFTRPNRRGQ